MTFSSENTAWGGWSKQKIVSDEKRYTERRKQLYISMVTNTEKKKPKNMIMDFWWQSTNKKSFQMKKKYTERRKQLYISMVTNTEKKKPKNMIMDFWWQSYELYVLHTHTHEKQNWIRFWIIWVIIIPSGIETDLLVPLYKTN